MGALRLLLALSVVISHTHPIYGFSGIGGSPAVLAFFIISGFYMGLVLDTQYANKPLLFYSNRALRLLPSYWTMLALMVVVAAIPSVRIDGGYSRHLISKAFDGSWLGWLSLAPNLFIVGADFFREVGANPKTGQFVWFTRNLVDGVTISSAVYFLWLPQIWSVAEEMYFYAVAPFLMRTRFWFGVVFVCAYLAREWAVASTHLNWLHLMPNYNFIYFLLGMTAYRMRHLMERIPSRMATVLSIVPFAYFATNDTLFWKPVWIWIPFAIAVPTLFQRTRDNRVDRLIGELSYPVYLVHFMFAASGRGPVMVAAESVIVALAMVAFVERPVESLRRRRATNTKDRPGSTAAAALHAAA